jgi:hypothetical protein
MTRLVTVRGDGLCQVAVADVLFRRSRLKARGTIEPWGIGRGVSGPSLLEQSPGPIRIGFVARVGYPLLQGRYEEWRPPALPCFSA